MTGMNVITAEAYRYNRALNLTANVKFKPTSSDLSWYRYAKLCTKFRIQSLVDAPTWPGTVSNLKFTKCERDRWCESALIRRPTVPGETTRKSARSGVNWRRWSRDVPHTAAHRPVSVYSASNLRLFYLCIQGKIRLFECFIMLPLSPLVADKRLSYKCKSKCFFLVN